MKNFTILASTIFVLLMTLPALEAQTCDFPPKGLQQEPRNEYRGRYLNEAYQYSLVIPEHFAGYDQPDATHHGFGLVFGAKQESYIVVDGAKNSLELNAPSDQAIQDLEYMRKEKKLVESANFTTARLDHLPSALLVATYTCSGSAKRYTQISAFALSPDKENAYELTLYCLANQCEAARTIFDQLLKSWKYAASVKTKAQHGALQKHNRHSESALRLRHEQQRADSGGALLHLARRGRLQGVGVLQLRSVVAAQRCTYRNSESEHTLHLEPAMGL